MNPSRATRFDFDAAGNRTSVVTTNAGGQSTNSYTANNLNQYTNVGGTNLAYDLNGNVTNDASGWTYTYDRDNRLTKAVNGTNTILYTYDVFNRLIKRAKGTNETRFYYAGWQLIEERDQNDTVVAKYVYGAGIDEPIKAQMADYSHGWFYYHADVQGNVTELTREDGSFLNSNTYDVYGKATTTPQDVDDVLFYSSNRLLFQGRDRDPDTGLYNFRNRYYSP